MTQTTAEELVIDRFRQKCRAAGGPRAGFVLRRASVLYGHDRYPDLDLEGAIADLVTRDLLKTSESGSFIFLTAQGVDLLASP